MQSHYTLYMGSVSTILQCRKQYCHLEGVLDEGSHKIPHSSSGQGFLTVVRNDEQKLVRII